jgi:uncharacterized protein YcnI
LRKLVSLTIVTSAVLLVLSTNAAAHVTIQPSSAPAGQFVRLDVRVPNELDDASTYKVAVKFPDGFIFASYEAVPGWKVSVKKSKLTAPVTAEGEKFTEQVSQITWTGQGKQGRIEPGQFRDFGLSVQIPDNAGTKLKFPAVQTYANGTVVRWIGSESSEEPTPIVEVTAPTGAENAAAASGSEDEEKSSSNEGSSDDSKTLSMIALIVGGLGLVLGGAAMAAARRRS